jgi:hypothetical protein
VKLDSRRSTELVTLKEGSRASVSRATCPGRLRNLKSTSCSLQFIEERLNEIRQWGAGVSIWELGQGLDYYYDLL